MPYASDGKISGTQIAGGIEITDVEYGLALEAMLSGRLVKVINGRLAIVDAPCTDQVQEPEDKPLTRDQVEANRLVAYANPVTGSDRYKAEAYAERLVGNEEAAAEADAKLVARRQQIRDENPWPESQE